MSSNGVNESYDDRESADGGDEFTKTKANEKKDKKVKRAEEKRRQKEAKRAAAAAEAAEAEYIPGAARPEKTIQPVIKIKIIVSLEMDLTCVTQCTVGIQIQ